MRWLNENSRLFLSRGYLTEGVTPEQRIRTIANVAESILGIEGFAISFMAIWKRVIIRCLTYWANFGIDKGFRSVALAPASGSYGGHFVHKLRWG